MSIATTSPALQAYHDAVRNNDPRAETLREQWKAEIDEHLNGLIDRTSHYSQVIKTDHIEKRGVKRNLYRELVQDYRLAMRLAKEISTVKKILRGAA